jgi:hypothetical protein
MGLASTASTFEGIPVKIQYLHLSVYLCEKCNGQWLQVYLRYARTKYRERQTSDR